MLIGCPLVPKTPFNTRVDAIPPSGIRRFFDLVSQRSDVISLGVGEPDYTTPWGICHEAIMRIEDGETHYTSNQGLPALRQCIAAKIRDHSGVAYNPETDIIVTVGASEGIDIALRAILNPGDQVIIPEPTYISYGPLVTLTGATAVPINTQNTGFIPTLDQIHAAYTPNTKALILCSPSNPTGMIIPPDRMREIAAFAQEKSIWVMVDEIYRELVYDGNFMPYLASHPDAQSHVIYIGGVSKDYAMTGWRIGYLCAPADLIHRALKIHQYSILCVPTVSQYAAIEALRHHTSAVHRMRADYDRRRQFIVNRLTEMGLPTALPQGALYCFTDIRATGLSSEAFAMHVLDNYGVAVVPGHVFGAGGEGYIRCCYAVSMAHLTTALDRIAACVHDLKS